MPLFKNQKENGEVDYSAPYFPPEHIEYPELTLYQTIERMAKKYPLDTAYEFKNVKTSYAVFEHKILEAARAFTAIGVERDDAVTICMPNLPQALDCFYALSRIGAVANMVHPMSAQKEITYFVDFSQSKCILTLDIFAEKVQKALAECDHPVTLLIARIQDVLPVHLKLPYTLTKGRAFLKYPTIENAMTWSDFLKKGLITVKLPESIYDTTHTAAILYSGGTTGTPKGICLSDQNFNATACQAAASFGAALDNHVTMLSCMPIFHGFGLGINIHTALMHGACCILMPSFTIDEYAKVLIKKRPNIVAGVPTIFEALLHIPQFDGVDLSFLIGMFCGGDSLSVELKKKIDQFLSEHNANIQIREGYGLTECVTASCLTPRDTYREGSIGLPFPDTVYAIVKPGSDEELPRGEEGEIILRGPSVMIGYKDNDEANAETLRTLSDGYTWLYTGDLGYMDEDGYVYFKQRIKRMIITNGYNVYPGQIENVIDSVPEVSYSCVIGVPDEMRMQRVRAYVVPKEGIVPSDELNDKIMDALKLEISGYALPREIRFRKELPKTLVGKVAYRVLEEEAAAEIAAAKAEEEHE